MSENKPTYKGREFYYKDKNELTEGYRYIRNQPLGSKLMQLSVENFVTMNPQTHGMQTHDHIARPKPRDYPGVL